MPDGRRRLLPIELATLSIGASYATLTTTAEPLRVFKIYNDTSAGITISYDGGTTDHEYLPTKGFLLIDSTANRAWDDEFVLSKSTVIQAKGAGSGTVYFSGFYAG